MSFITGKHIPRRTFLRGVGATVALPFLDAMVPAGRVFAKTRAADRTRLICIEEVHGLAGCNNWAATKHLFAPQQTGPNFTLVPDNPLSTLEAHRDYMTIISNTDCRNAEAFSLPEIGGDHFRSTAVFLTQAKPKQTQGSDIWAGTSLDQIYAKRFGQATPLPSMQFCIENLDQAGGCTYNYSCAYTDSLRWASPNEPLPMIRDPRVAFDMLFGSGTTSADRKARRERRIKAIEARNTSGEQRELPDAPAGVPDSYSEHIKLMFDLQVLAMESDMTRIIAFKTGRDAQNRVFPESGSNQPFHPSSHHGNREDRIMEFNKICKFRVSQLDYFLSKMKQTMEGEASLLDKSLIIFGSPMADANIHNHRRCPLVLLGRGNGMLKGNVHLKAADATPMANVFLTLMHNLGVDDMQTFGDSPGEFSLAAPSLTAAV